AFLTAFLDRSSQPFKKSISELAWGSYAWFSTEPDYIIDLSPHRSPIPWFRRFWAPGRDQDSPIAHFSCQGTRQEKRFSCFSLSQGLWRMFF
ncbi:BsuBI/PstI family type II restriction endonuclease, partial [Thiolapillus sp.]|uniref:BsuBI/PstI family type II restriction endonuclease n=1 Tax=Thiolapillus sp. TaxID=2017437 RepID=UPI003AF72F08